MKIPELKLGDIYYIFTFGQDGYYAKFLTQFLPLDEEIVRYGKYYARYSKNINYTEPFEEAPNPYDNRIGIYSFQRSVIIHESSFKEYKEIIRIPALNLSRRQSDIYIRQIIIDNIIKNL